MLTWIISASWCQAAEARVVHQRVNGYARFLQFIKQFNWRSGMSKVFGRDPHRDAVLPLQLFSELLQGGSIAGHQHQIVVVGSKQPRQFQPDATGGTGNQSCL
jgi:hypothetical protein